MNSEVYKQEQNTEQTQRTTAKIKTKYGLVKYLILTLITCGLYSIYTHAKIGDQLNLIAGRYDGKRTMNFWLLMIVIVPLTAGIGWAVWMHKISNRLGDELRRRGIDTSFGAGSFWLWNIIGLFIFIGPFIYTYKLFKNMNLLIEDYNHIG